MTTADISELIWASRYRGTDSDGMPDASIEDTWRRVARAVAALEPDAEGWQRRFESALAGFRFLPGGRILAGAGLGTDVTLFNCFVAGRLVDSLEGILESLSETALTMQHGGGVGLDFSPLRPRGSPAVRTGATASGPVSFMHVWDTMCETLLATGRRRGAMMGTLRCDHPDIEVFVDAKRDAGVLHNFNLSVLVTDAFLRAVDEDRDWTLAWPPGEAAVSRKSLPARKLWRRIVASALETAEPGVLFVDTINRDNNLGYCETISATNPCGEVPLPPYGACNLGSINLAAAVSAPFSAAAAIDHAQLERLSGTAVRFLDNVIDVSRFPLPKQAEQARRTRRIGLGITGLGDALAMLGLRYDSADARNAAIEVMRTIRDSAYRASVELAAEKGAFPAYDAGRYCDAPFIRRLPPELRKRLERHGIRNSHLLSIAPAGTISLLAGNLSSGVEPIYALEAERTIRGAGQAAQDLVVDDFAFRRWRAQCGGGCALPESFVTSGAISGDAHLAMQASLQPYVDNAISKTITLSPGATADTVDDIFRRAHRAGIKGCTVFRPGSMRGEVIRRRDEAHCCGVERECD
jgi:ribonucleoside-diphosphate reductase alpha chain